MKKTIFILLAGSLLIHGINTAYGQGKLPSHELWNELLKKNVSNSGKVNYKDFIKDSAQLDKYLKILSANPPDEKHWTINEQKAYWINAYNAFTVKLITMHYPLASIKDIGSKIQIPFVNTPWEVKFFYIGSEKMDLDEIEHGELRKKFADPRIHFSIVCASKSCPKLLNEAYEPEKLDRQLDGEARAFLKDTTRNKISPDNIQISKLFEWYKGDFTKNGGTLIDFLNKYAPVKINQNAKISHLSYNWSLNE